MTVPQRCKQALRWMQHEWPCGRPIRIRWVKELIDPDDGEAFDADTLRHGNELVIRMSRRRNRTYYSAIDTLIHEYAHCLLWGMASVEEHPRLRHHPAALWAQYGEIRDHWDHDYGWEQSKEF